MTAAECFALSAFFVMAAYARDEKAESDMWALWVQVAMWLSAHMAYFAGVFALVQP